MSTTGAVHFPTLSEGRSHFSELVDAAVEGRPASVQRNSSRSALVDADRLRTFLSTYLPAGTEVVPENGGWTIVMPGQPFAAEGDSLNDAVDDMVTVLRDYASDWSERLRLAPNHSSNWALVQLIDLSDDDQLRAWLVGT